MKLPELKIGDLVAKLPIIQGGMGVGVSLSGLAGNVAKEGGVGIISVAQAGYNEPDFETNNLEANIRAIKNEIKKAKEISEGNGIVGVNIMHVATNYVDFVKASVESNIDLIISGAGLPKELPELIQGTKTKIAPIVSSVRGAVLMIKMWIQKHNYVPDMIVVEGPEAGGHLGFSYDELTTDKKPDLLEIVKGIINEVKVFEKETNKKIPVIAAGGIYTGADIAKFLNVGAAGVQMATRFVTTFECDAHENFKKAYLSSKEEDIQIVQSPVGMPGRAIHNEFIDDESKGKITKCYKCIKTCNPATTPYCITKALITSVKGNTKNGLLFCGSNAYKTDKLVSVKELINELVTDAELAYNV